MPSGSLHTHDWILIGLAAFVAVVGYRFLAHRTAQRSSKINIDDLFLDDTTRRLSWSKTAGMGGIGLLGAVLLQQALAGRPLDTIYGVFALSVVGPIITRILKGGEQVTPAEYIDPKLKPNEPSQPINVGQINQAPGA